MCFCDHNSYNLSAALRIIEPKLEQTQIQTQVTKCLANDCALQPSLLVGGHTDIIDGKTQTQS